TAVIPQLGRLAREDGGRQKIMQYTRYATVVLCLFQGYLLAISFQHPESYHTILGGIPDTIRKLGIPLVADQGWAFRIATVITLTTGTLFLMWLGDQITERGIGNGISLIIFGGIVAGLPAALGGTLELVRTGAMSVFLAIVIFAVVVLVTGVVVFIEKGQRRILVNYAKRQVGNRLYGGQSSFLPLKLNMSGVIPPIFASSIILFPATLAS